MHSLLSIQAHDTVKSARILGHVAEHKLEVEAYLVHGQSIME
jgi:hypothetical protein